MSEPWLLETLRFTLFPYPNQIFLDKESWWEGSTGETPEAIEERPRDAGYKAEGQFNESSNLVLNTVPDRIDWFLYPKNGDSQKADLPFPMIGDNADNKAQFSNLILKWLNLVDLKVHRIAFGTTLILPASSHIDAYSKLSSFLTTVQIDPTNSSDFNYSINRPRQSLSNSELKLNRLSKWNVIRTVQSRLTSAGVSSAILNERYVCRLELDINNLQTDVDISDGEGISTLLVELMSLAEEISDNGDIP